MSVPSQPTLQGVFERSRLATNQAIDLAHGKKDLADLEG